MLGGTAVGEESEEGGVMGGGVFVAVVLRARTAGALRRSGRANCVCGFRFAVILWSGAKGKVRGGRLSCVGMHRPGVGSWWFPKNFTVDGCVLKRARRIDSR